MIRGLLGSNNNMSTLRVISAVRRLSTKRFPEHTDVATKPKLSQFKYPLYHSFLIASCTYIFLNTVWYKLEHDTVEALLLEQSAELELTIQGLVNEKKQELTQSKKLWWKWR